MSKPRVVGVGICVSPGIAEGACKVLREAEDVDKVECGDVVILTHSHPMFALAMMKASAAVCERGGRLSHICIVAMEMGIPCITQVLDATNKVKDGQRVRVDAERGMFYVDE